MYCLQPTLHKLKYYDKYFYLMKKIFLPHFDFDPHARYHQPPNIISTLFKLTILISNLSL